MNIRLAIAWFVVPVLVLAIGCGSESPQVDPSEEAEDLSRNERVVPSRDPVTVEFSGALRLDSPIQGRLTVTRHTERTRLETIDDEMTYTIRMIPLDGGGVRVETGTPEIAELRSRLPEDVLNRLLIGRSYLLSGTLTSEGEFEPSEIERSVATLHDALRKASSLGDEVTDRFLESSLSQQVLQTVSREHWRTMLVSPAGQSMTIGESYETEAPTDLPMGGTVTLRSTVRLVSFADCDEAASVPKCARIEADFEPISLLDRLPEPSPGSPKISRMIMTSSTSQLIEPDTLQPFELVIDRKTDAELNLPNGSSFPMTEKSTESWHYDWNPERAERSGP